MSSKRSFALGASRKALLRAVLEKEGVSAELSPPGSTIPRRPDTGSVPFSFSQQRLWFLDKLGAGAAYNMPLFLRLSREIDEKALSRALREIVRRHEVLRTTIPEVDGHPHPVVATDPAIDVALVDSRELDAPSREVELSRLAAE
ncbi:MAG: condensation domain-containing protein, partial [Vicinamibacteria bacterium]